MEDKNDIVPEEKPFDLVQNILNRADDEKYSKGYYSSQKKKDDGPDTNVESTVDSNIALILKALD